MWKINQWSFCKITEKNICIKLGKAAIKEKGYKLDFVKNKNSLSKDNIKRGKEQAAVLEKRSEIRMSNSYPKYMKNFYKPIRNRHSVLKRQKTWAHMPPKRISHDQLAYGKVLNFSSH